MVAIVSGEELKKGKEIASNFMVSSEQVKKKRVKSKCEGKRLQVSSKSIETEAVFTETERSKH